MFDGSRGNGLARQRKNKSSNGGANIGFEETLWAAADKMRGSMDPGEYKHVALGLIFLKYISDAFQHRYDQLKQDPLSDLEDPDEYRAENVFWVPPEARWETLQRGAKQPTIGQTVDDAMIAIERDNPSLKGVLPKDYARPALDKQRLGELIDLIGTIAMAGEGADSRDVLGRVYEYFLGKFAGKEGKAGGDFYTPRCIVRLLVEMIEPYRGRVYDPCCGSGGMFVQSESFILAHGGQRTDVAIFGQEFNPTTWRLAKMNLAIRGIEANLGSRHADSFHDDLHPDLRADFILANPPFNVSDWGGDRLRSDVRWRFGAPPVGNANFAWVQHFVHHLSPAGVAGFVLANGSMSSNTSGEGEIRKNLVEAGLVDCMVALPGQLFYGTQIPACLWFLARDRTGRHSRAGGNPGPTRDRRGEVLFIDARKMGVLVDRTHRELTDEDIARIAGAYHAWRSGPVIARAEPEAISPDPVIASTECEAIPPAYADIPGFCKSATLDEVRAHGHVLTPGRYVGAEAAEDDGEPFEEKMQRLVGELEQQFEESHRLEAAIRENMRDLKR